MHLERSDDRTGVGAKMRNGYFRGSIPVQFGKGWLSLPCADSLDCCYYCFWTPPGSNNKTVLWVDTTLWLLSNYRESSYL